MEEMDDIERQIRDLMLAGDDDQIFSNVEEIIRAMGERDCSISLVLEGLLEEVDRLILIAEEIEACEDADESEEPGLIDEDGSNLSRR